MTHSTKPDLIIFDLGRVLVDFDFKKVIRDLKRYTAKSESEIRDFFKRTPLWDSFERGTTTPTEFFKGLKKGLELTNLTFKDFVPLWNDIFTEKSDSLAILRKLRGRYRLALLSNVNEMHWTHIVERHAFIEWFDPPIASYAVGHRKPEAAIYQLTLQRAGGCSPPQSDFHR